MSVPYNLIVFLQLIIKAQRVVIYIVALVDANKNVYIPHPLLLW